MLLTFSHFLACMHKFGVMLEPLAILTLLRLILTAVWQIVVGVKLYKLGQEV
jgi:hypothetical protein